VKSGRQPGARIRRREWITVWAACCVRRPRCRAGRSARTGVDGQPQPQYLLGAAEPRPQFVQLEIGKLEMTEKVLVKALCVLPSAGEPGGDRRMTVAEDTLGSRSIQSFGQRRQHDRDLLGRGFQPVQGSVTSCTEGGAAGLTPKRLDALDTAMLAISDQGVDVSIADPGVRALGVGTGETLGVHLLGCSPSTFHLAPGPHKQRRWTSTRRGDAGEATSGAIKWGAWRCRRRWSEVRLAAVLDWAGP
jgi:hypothetical protein